MLIDLPSITWVSDMGLIDFIINLINWIIGFSAVVSVVMIIASGYQFMFAGGDDKKTKKAVSSLLSAILGMILVFIAPLVIQFVIDKFLG